MPKVERVGHHADPNQRPQRQEPAADGWAAFARGDDQRRTHTGQKRRKSRERRRPAVGDDGDGQQTDASQRGHRCQRAWQANRDSGDRRETEQGSQRQLPRPGGQQVEGHVGAAAYPVCAKQQRADENNQRGWDLPPRGRGQAEGSENERPADIELLFERQRPGVQQERDLGVGRKVTGPPVEQNVGREGRRGHHGFAKRLQLQGRQEEVAQRRHCREHDEQCGKDSANAPLVEDQHRKLVGPKLALDDLRDEVARNHEEDIDPDESARAESTGME